MKKLLIVGFVVLVAAACVAIGAQAQSNVPENVQVFELADLVCVLWPDGSGECYCPCQACYVTTDSTDEPTTVPATPTQAPPTTVPPTEKPKCNSGRGNGSEGNPDCDPGNSGGHNNGGD